MVFGVGVVVEAALGGLSELVVAGFDLVGVVGAVVFLGGLVDEILGVGALGAEGEGGEGMLVGGFEVLVVASVAGELCGAGAEFGRVPCFGGGPWGGLSSLSPFLSLNLSL